MRLDLPTLLQQLDDASRLRGLSAREWAEQAGIRPETLARLKTREDCDLATLSALAAAVDMHLMLSRDVAAEMPARFGRDEEEALLLLCASRSMDMGEWSRAGPHYFMAGLAVLLAGMPEMDRPALLMLSEGLYPGMSSVQVYQGWLDKSPLKPSRFLPMLYQRMGELRKRAA